MRSDLLLQIIREEVQRALGGGSIKQKPPTVVLGTIDPSYVAGSGPPKVIFDDDTSQTPVGPYPYDAGYAPIANDRVYMLRVGVSGKFVVVGRVDSNSVSWQTPSFQNGFTEWGNGFKSLSYTKTPSGLVLVQGLCGTPSSVGVSETIFMLPQGYRPAAHMMFPIVTGNTTSLFIEIHSDGTVMTGEVNTFPTNSWIAISALFLAEK